MKLVVLCLALASTAFAVPYQYLPQYRPLPHPQVKSIANGFQPGLQGGYSVEFIYPMKMPGGAGPAEPFPRYGLIKYSIPQPPGRQSVEVFYPYDFTEQRIVPDTPMSNAPIPRDVLPFGYPPQTVPQQNTNNVPFGYPQQNGPQQNSHIQPSQDPVQQPQQDQPIQAGQPLQVPAKV